MPYDREKHCMKKWAVIIVWAIAGLIFAESVDELLKIGDHFLKRGEYEDALKNYRRAESIDPDNPQVLWRIGAAYNLKAQNFIEKTRLDTLKAGNTYLSKAIKLDKEIPQAHSQLAYNLALMILFTENVEDIKDFAIISRIKEEVDYALKLDSKDALAHYVLGLWHQQVGKISILKRKPHGLGDADTSKALEEFKKATKYDENCAEYWYMLGREYIAKGDTSSALKCLKRATETPTTPRNKQFIENAQELIDTIIGKNQSQETKGE